MHSRKNAAHQLSPVSAQQSQLSAPLASTAKLGHTKAVKMSCGQKSLQKSKQLCCALLHAPSAVQFEAWLLSEAQKPCSQGCRR